MVRTCPHYNMSNLCYRCAVSMQQGVVSNCRADVRDMLTDLAYVLEHAATATDANISTTNDATSTTADSTAAIAGTAVDSMEMEEEDEGNEYGGKHTAVAAVVGSSADMVFDDVSEHAVINANSAAHIEQQQQYQHNSSSTQARLPSTPIAAGTMRFLLSY
jgi:hypothetical protein